jgi:uncharacterized protein YgiM (DUF1202 family)
MKIRVYTVLSLLMLVTYSSSCGNKKLQAADAKAGLIDSNTQQELFVWVENARIRTEADLKAAVVAEIKAGEKLLLTGETSTLTTKVKIRGVEMEDVWVKVKTAGGAEGWIFKGMLTDDEEKASAMNDFLITPGTSVGRVKLGSKKQEVEQVFGAQFIKEGDIFFPEGMSAKGFYIFKDDALELQCVTNEKTGVIETILIRQPSSSWATANGIKIGTRLDDLVKMNEKPIRFSGFGWDYGGNVLSYNNGKLAGLEGQLSINLGEPDDITGLEEFLGDTECSTASKKILGKGVKVAEIGIFMAPAI